MRLLISVIDPSECAAFSRWPDYLDVKNPSDGSLGMPSPETVLRISQLAGEHAVISAAIGDATDNPELYTERGVAVTRAGADIVKVGLFSFKNLGQAGKFLTTIRHNLVITGKIQKLVCAAYADRADRGFIAGFPEMAQKAGMWGCLLDTYDKAKGKLTAHVPLEDLRDFVANCGENGVASALAGGLDLDDIGWLREVAPDIVGFRSAVTKSARNVAGIDQKKLAELFAHWPMVKSGL